MKITFIEPGSPGLHVFSKVRLPRLGLPLLATILRDGGHDTRVYVEDISEVSMDRVLSSDLIGISTTTSTAPRAYSIADMIKAARSDLPIVMGGPHATFLPAEALSHADYCVIGEGEHTIVELVRQIEKGERVTQIPGLATRDAVGKQAVQGPSVVDIAEVPCPDLTLIDGYERMHIAPVATSRGCPYGCRFCSVVKMFGRAYRQRRIEDVVAELLRYEGKSVFFYDDNFAAVPERTRDLLDAMKRSGFRSQWSAQVRVEIGADGDLLDSMREAGATQLHIGFESVNQASLDEFDKHIDMRQVAGYVKAIHDRGIRIHGMFVMGADGDDAETPKRTVDFALKNGIETIQLMMLTPLPGTDYFREMSESGRLITTDWRYYDGHHVVHKPAQMSPYRMQYEVMKEMARFYSLRRCMGLAMKLDFIDSYFRFYGWKTIKEWFADQANRDYLDFLRREWQGAV